MSWLATSLTLSRNHVNRYPGPSASRMGAERIGRTPSGTEPPPVIRSLGGIHVTGLAQVTPFSRGGSPGVVPSWEGDLGRPAPAAAVSSAGGWPRGRGSAPAHGRRRARG